MRDELLAITDKGKRKLERIDRDWDTANNVQKFLWDQGVERRVGMSDRVRFTGWILRGISSMGPQRRSDFKGEFWPRCDKSGPDKTRKIIDGLLEKGYIEEVDSGKEEV